MSLQVERQVAIPVEYQGLKFEEGFRADLLVENKVMVELKCVERLNNAHKKQRLTYLRLTDTRLGYLLTWRGTHEARDHPHRQSASRTES